MSAGAEDGGDAELHLQVEEVVPSVFEKQVLKNKQTNKTNNFAKQMSNVSVNVQPPAEAHQEQVHRVESAELLRYHGVAGGAGVQQGRHQSSNVQARVPEWFLQHTQRRKHGASLNMEASRAGRKTAKHFV